MPTLKQTQSNSEKLSLVFKPEDHSYWIGKKRIPSVSEILQKVGLTKDFKGIDPYYRDRGIATHKAIEFYLNGVLDETSLDPAVKPHFEAFRSYQAARPMGKILGIEKPLCDLSECFAGTPDLVTEIAVYDWKCSKNHDKAAELQGQAYKNLIFLNWMRVGRSLKIPGNLPFIVVELHDDGSFEEFNYGPDYEEWSSVMSLYRWKLGK